MIICFGIYIFDRRKMREGCMCCIRRGFFGRSFVFDSCYMRIPLCPFLERSGVWVEFGVFM